MYQAGFFASVARPSSPDIIHVATAREGLVCPRNEYALLSHSQSCTVTDILARAVEGISGNITGHNLDLSQAAFKGLTSNLKLGTTLVQWYLTDDKHRPKASLKSYPVGGGGATETDETGGTVLTGAVMPTKAYEPAIMTV